MIVIGDNVAVKEADDISVSVQKEERVHSLIVNDKVIIESTNEELIMCAYNAFLAALVDGDAMFDVRRYFPKAAPLF